MREGYMLYFDTSDPEAIIGLLTSKNDYGTFRKRQFQAGRELSAKLSDVVKNLLKEYKVGLDQIKGVVVFVGPGSFTGLRIGISFANAFAYALGAPVFETKKKEDFNLSKPKKFAVPYYGAKPHITKSKRK